MRQASVSTALAGRRRRSWGRPGSLIRWAGPPRHPHPAGSASPPRATRGRAGPTDAAGSRSPRSDTGARPAPPLRPASQSAQWPRQRGVQRQSGQASQPGQWKPGAGFAGSECQTHRRPHPATDPGWKASRRMADKRIGTEDPAARAGPAQRCTTRGRTLGISLPADSRATARAKSRDAVAARPAISAPPGPVPRPSSQPRLPAVLHLFCGLASMRGRSPCLR